MNKTTVLGTAVIFLMTAGLALAQNQQGGSGGMMGSGMMGHGMMGSMMNGGPAGQPGAANAAASWEAPQSAAAKKNPVPASAASVASGQTIYTQQCFYCHGKTGKGDGPAARGIHPRPADLTASDVAKQSDGALFWKITNGHSPMPAFQYTLTANRRWDVINYVRTLSK